MQAVIIPSQIPQSFARRFTPAVNRVREVSFRLPRCRANEPEGNPERDNQNGSSSYDEPRDLENAIGFSSLASKSLLYNKKTMGKQALSFEDLQKKPWRKFGSANWVDYVLYRYYMGRKGTVDDLSVFAISTSLLILFLVGLRVVVRSIDLITPEEANPLLVSFYDVIKLAFGEFGEDHSTVSRLFSILVAAVGFVGFAIGLAIGEQALLELIERNVKVGTQVYEDGHFLVLAFCTNPRDTEIIITVLQQMCVAYKDVDGCTLVLLCEKPKLEMEAFFRRVLPANKRYGSQIVFRQGSPLVPEDLNSVNAARAAATVVIADRSRQVLESDAQSLQCATMLDKLCIQGESGAAIRTGHVIVETLAMNATTLIKGFCSPRIVPMPTTQLNARRIARLIQQPVVASVSARMWDFDSNSRASVKRYPELDGQKYSDVPFLFTDSTPLGIVNERTCSITLFPGADCVLEDHDYLVMMRKHGSQALKPMTHVGCPPDESWQPTGEALNYFRHLMSKTQQDPLTPFTSSGHAHHTGTATDRSTGDIWSALSVDQPYIPPDETDYTDASPGMTSLSNGIGDTSSRRSHTDRLKNGKWPLPLFFNHADDGFADRPVEHVLICGWRSQQFMLAILVELDHGQTALPRGSHVTFFNDHTPETCLSIDGSRLKHLVLHHKKGNPLIRRHFRKLDMTPYTSALLCCDEKWMDPDEDASNGFDDITTRGDLLRLDSMVFLAQLNLRQHIQDSGTRQILIIHECLSVRGKTQVQDDPGMPLGISINFVEFSAHLLSFAGYHPKILLPYTRLGQEAEIVLFDSSLLCDLNEPISYWQLQRRAQKLQCYVFGYWTLPEQGEAACELVCNPLGFHERSEKRVWNDGSKNIKIAAYSRRNARTDLGDAEMYESETGMGAIAARAAALDKSGRSKSTS